MYLELASVKIYLEIWLCLGPEIRAAGARTGVCGYPASSLCRRAPTFSAGPASGLASGAGTRIDGVAAVAVTIAVATVAAVARQRRCVEDGVSEQHELDRHGTWRAARRVPALGES